MDTRRFLNNIRSQWNEINILERRIDDIDASMMLHAIQYDQSKVQCDAGDAVSDRATTLIDYKRELRRIVVRFIEDHKLAQNLINSLEDTRQRQILEVYFLSIPPRSMNETAREVGYSIKHTYRLLDNAINALPNAEELNFSMR